MKVISVFGSARPKPDTPDYVQAYEVGRLLAKNGYAVATGGYMGTMEGVSKGASEAGGHVIGVTSQQIELYRPIAPNQWVAEEIKYDSLRERMLHLVMNNDGAIVLPGGVGTLAELALAWNLIQVDEIGARPFVLLGDIWKRTFEAFISADYVTDETAAIAQYADTLEQAVQLIMKG